MAAGRAGAQAPVLPGRLASIRRRFIVGMVLLALAVVFVVVSVLREARQQKEAEVAATVENFSAVLDQSISNSARKIDLSLLAIADRLERQWVVDKALNAAEVNRLLDLQHRWNDNVGEFRVTDAQGVVRYGAGVEPGSRFSYADRPFFATLRDDSASGTVVSMPVLGRVSKIWVVVLARRYTQPDGAFGGVIAAAVPLTYFTRELQGLKLGVGGVAALRDQNGGLMARYPESTASYNDIGTKVYSQELAQIMASDQRAVTYHATQTTDGLERILSYRRLTHPPFHLLVGMGAQGYLADWYAQVLRVSAAGAIFLLIAYGFSRSLWRAFVEQDASRRRSEELLLERDTASDSLQTQTRLLSEVVESLPYGLAVYDAQRVMRLHNSSLRSVLRLPDELLAQQRVLLDDLVRHFHARGDYGPDIAFEPVLARMQDVLHARQAQSSERRQADGSTVEFRTFPISSGWTVLTYLDVTARIEQQRVLSEAQERVRLATESAGVGIWEVDLVTGVQRWDAQQCRLYGLEPVEIRCDHATWVQFVHPDDMPAADQAYQRALAEGVDYACDFRVIRRDGALRHMRDLGRIRRDAQGRAVSMVGTNLDVTEALLAAQALEEARDRAEQASISKGQFLANMSHEIRTPMNAVLGLLQLLEQTRLDPAQLAYVQKIQGAARSLLGILNDVLDFSKIEANHLELEVAPFGLQRLLDELSDVLSTSVGAKSIEVLYDLDAALPEWLSGDALRLKQVLLNLGANAVKFTSEGQVVIGVRRDRVADADGALGLAFSVQDSGIGIAPQDQARLFDSFSQAEASTTRRYGGTGLGLAISKRLVEHMGGSIAVHSVLGQGSTFSFSLRFAPAAAPAGVAGQRNTPPPQRVLLVDDNPVALALHARMLRGMDWDVEAVGDCAQALDAARRAVAGAQAGYSLVLLDWQMRGADGWETLRLLRPILAGQPVAPRYVMVSANGRDSLAQRTPDEQAQIGAFLVKPLTVSMVRTAALATSPAAQATQPSSRRQLVGLRLLVVEDNAINQQIAEELLVGQGAQVSIAADGRQGVNAVASAKPQYDLVLMDVQMPVQDGYSATRAIRSMGLRSLPIVGLTANAMDADRNLCLQAGMNAHLGKPFDLQELVQLVLELTGRSAPDGAAPPDTAPPAVAALPQDLALPQTPADALPVLDLAGALHRMGHARSLFLSLARSMLAELARWPANWKALAQAGDSRALQAALHSSKGSGATLGLTRLAAQLAVRERACKELAEGPDLDRQLQARALGLGALDVEVAQARAALEAALAQVQEEHQREAARNSPRAPAPTSAGQAPETQRGAGTALGQQALRHLLPLLASSDLTALDVFSSMRAQLEQLPGTTFPDLEQALQALDIPRALALCQDALLD